MKIRRIEIEFVEFDEDEDHAKRAVFSEGKWTFDGLLSMVGSSLLCTMSGSG